MISVLLTNIPAPYREKIHRIVSDYYPGEYFVIYCQDREADRKWQFEYENYNKYFLKKSVFHYKDRYIHVNFDIWKFLNKINPDIVITTGFNPTFIIAFLWSMIKGKKHICMTDGWSCNEMKLSYIHTFIRKFVYKRSYAFIGPSDKTMDLYRNYKCRSDSLFKSYLCADNKLYSKYINTKKKYDIIFSGQLIHRKLPIFFCEVLKKVKVKKANLHVLIIGDGILKEQVLNLLNSYEIHFDYPGFINQKELPNYYASSRLLLFPTSEDCWGVVVNEAMAVGTPVITTPYTAVADELVINGVTGYVLKVDVDLWVEHIIRLLNDENLLKLFSTQSLEIIKKYNYNDAARGIIDAIAYADNCERKY